MKFMIVDDSNVIRSKISNVLTEHNFEIVGSAENGVEAVKQFKEIRPKVMTLDITMPLMDGIETIKEIIAIDQDVRILVVSALADKATLIKAMSIGAYGFVCKPFTDIDLLDAIHELIEDLV